MLELSSSSKLASCAYQRTYLALPTTTQAPLVTQQPTQAGSRRLGTYIGRALELGVNWPHLLVAQPPVWWDPCGLILGAWLRSEARLHFHYIKSRRCHGPRGSGGFEASTLEPQLPVTLISFAHSAAESAALNTYWT